MGGSSAWSYFTDYLPWEFGSSVGEMHMMVAAEARGMWQRTAAKCHMVQEDAIRSPKVVHCPRTRSSSGSQPDAGHPMGYKYYWTNGCFSPETKLDNHGQNSPTPHPDYHFQPDETVHARFSKPSGLQTLAAESTLLMKTDPGLISAASDYSTTELELEWQLLIDPQDNAGHESPMSDCCKEEEDVAFDEEVWCDTKQNGLDVLQQEQPFEFGTSEIATKGKYDGRPQGFYRGACLSRQQLLASNCGALVPELSENQGRSSKSSIRLFLCQLPEKEDSVEQTVQKTVEHLERCSFSCPQPRLITNFDNSLSRHKQSNVLQDLPQTCLSSLPCGRESDNLEDTDQSPSSLCLSKSDTFPGEPCHCQRMSKPLSTSSIDLPTRRGTQSFSFGNSSSQFNAGVTATMDKDAGLFAEALCHSQTRAREAEKKVQRAFEEKERLMHLFFNEAYLAFTYRQWVTSLQSENMWLRMSPRHQPAAWLQHNVVNSLSTLEKLSSKYWRSFSHDYQAQYLMDQIPSAVWNKKAIDYLTDPNDIMMGYTFAFALGLSLAGAGLVLGWSMGWILLAC